MITYVCYTHSDYSDIWPLVFGQIANLVKLPKIVYSNEIKNHPFDRALIYDDTKTYPQKLVDLCNEVNSKYIVLVHDNDLVMNFNNELCQDYVEEMELKQIDRLMFGILKRRENNERFVKAEKNMTSHFLTPYDVGPSIWKKDALLKAMSTELNTSYRQIEFGNIQNWVEENLNVMGLTSDKTSTTLYSIGRPFNSEHAFCHILCQGKWLEFYTYMDYYFLLPKLLEYYKIDISKRGILYEQYHIDVNNRDV
jgi:hypothetical protein